MVSPSANRAHVELANIFKHAKVQELRFDMKKIGLGTDYAARIYRLSSSLWLSWAAEALSLHHSQSALLNSITDPAVMSPSVSV